MRYTTVEFIDKVSKVRLVEVEVKVSKAAVKEGMDPLWPRVTLEFEGVRRVFPFTHHALVKKSMGSGAQLTPLEQAIVKMIGGVSKFNINHSGQSGHYLRNAAKSINRSVLKRMASHGKKIGVEKMLDRSRRSRNKKNAMDDLRVFFQDHSDFSENEVLGLLRLAKAEGKARDVMEA